MNEINEVRIPIMSFRSNGIMFYEVNSNLRNRQLASSAFQENSAKLQHRQRYVGFVTDGIKKRMKKCITLLLQSTPWTYKTNPVSGRIESHKVSFITLTTPTHENSYSAKFCHKHLLEPLLRKLRREHGMKSYIWKVELQANKQIHYHITADIVINHTTLRDIWNNLLRKYDMLQQFKLKYGHDNPNSTDIHKVYHVRNLEAYLVKYICKEYQNEDKLDAKIWDASQNIKSADYFKTELDFPFHQYIRSLQETLMVNTSYFEKAIFLDFKTTDYYTFFSDNIINEFFKHLKKIQLWHNVLDTVKKTSEKILRTVIKESKPVGNRWTGEQLKLGWDYLKNSLTSWNPSLKDNEMNHCLDGLNLRWS